MVSHEYRTPLTTILSSAELLEQYSHQWHDEKKQRHFQRIQTSVHRLTQLVNDVLLINKAEAGKLEFNPVPLNLVALCRELVEDLQLTAKTQHSISFDCQGSCSSAYLDDRLVRQLLTNLLSNAIKYSPEGGNIQFDLVFEHDSAVIETSAGALVRTSAVTFRIRDQGIGIPPEDQAQLFDAFYRSSNVGTISGTGLGLAIVKKCVDLHGGQIAVESEVGLGTTFTVILPLNI